jgi:hypothetical protein
VTRDVAEQAAIVESAFIDLRKDSARTWVKMAYYLDLMDRDQLFLARGYPSFRAWTTSPEIDFSYRMAHDMLRVKRELIPLLTEQLGDEQAAIRAVIEAGSSKARAVLPLLKANELDQAADLIALAPELRYDDVTSQVKSITNPEIDQLNERYPVMFRARLTAGDTHTRVMFTGSDGIQVANMGTLNVPNGFMDRLLNTKLSQMISDDE